MGSLDKNVKEKQFTKAKADFDAYAANMKANGIEEKLAKKNAIYRKLRANVRTARNRIIAIDKAAAHVEAMKAKSN